MTGGVTPPRRSQLRPLLRPLSLLATAAAGWLVAAGAGLTGAAHSPVYSWVITALLGLGLYAAAFGIDLSEARAHLRTVLLAVTVGVLAKVALIAGVMLLFFDDDPRVVLLAVAVAQIDPLSVAALRDRSRLSPAGRSLLSAWASFDDPVTVLLTAYLAAFVLPGDGATGLGVLDTGVVAVLLNLGLNLVFAAAVAALWWAFRARARRRREPLTPARRRVLVVLTTVLVLGLAVFAVANALLLGLAFVGLVVRPAIGPVIDRLAAIALYAGTFAIGVVLVNGVGWVPGLVLGVAAFLAQAVIALVLPATGLARGDRLGLALAQQNGLTAIVLALLLEPVYPGAAGTVAFAVLVINAGHGLANARYNRPPPAPDGPGPAPRPAPADPPAAPEQAPASLVMPFRPPEARPS
ncbi:hypothetical protein [Actinokineospora sp. NBRC 105648]|uniref:hypothetical protein n=1 Tax=Actinokineospora sp. NBRC 105648 TaxID=3032206 RepID=UPI0024A02DAF|nr:hypothetical protein [Actinokineospora sp. NBRC 105648]GLZ41966.1 hypothetical protein Acsp05_55900 [Actinokineospora sp. NBRC 105648]